MITMGAYGLWRLCRPCFYTDERDHYKLEKLWADMPSEMVQ